MTLKTQNANLILHTGIFLLILTSLLISPIAALALGNSTSFSEFYRSVQNGDANTLRGVYVTGTLALPVVQQPYGNAGYVSTQTDVTTQFRMAAAYGNVGLLAHNYLAGQYFSDLKVGQEVRLIYGDGHMEYFVISAVLKYQALQPNNPYSSFRNLNGNETVTANEMFRRVYLGDRHVTFQTCIQANGNSSWGRLFIIAVPEDKSSLLEQWPR